MGSRHYITQDVLKMIERVISGHRGSKAAFCRITGITSSSLAKILNGGKKFVYGDEWARLVDYIPELEYVERGEPVPLETPEAAEITSGRIYVEDFRSALIGELISADIDPVELQKVLRLVNNFRKGETNG